MGGRTIMLEAVPVTTVCTSCGGDLREVRSPSGRLLQIRCQKCNRGWTEHECVICGVTFRKPIVVRHSGVFGVIDDDRPRRTCTPACKRVAQGRKRKAD
jgi:hypothetical protein